METPLSNKNCERQEKSFKITVWEEASDFTGEICLVTRGTKMKNKHIVRELEVEFEVSEK